MLSIDSYLRIAIFVTIGIILLWFGYTLFFRPAPGGRPGRADKSRRSPRGKSGSAAASDSPASGDSRICPVCSARLNKGELIQSTTFPPPPGGKDQIMHIRGCTYCLGGERRRECPVCGAALRNDETLIARMFDRVRRRKHVHVLGCSRCRKAAR